MRISDWSSDVCSSDLAHAWPLEHLLGDEAEGDDGAELQPGDGDDRHQGVLQRVAEVDRPAGEATGRSEEHTSELQSLMRSSYAVFCLKKKKKQMNNHTSNQQYQTTSKVIDDPSTVCNPR